MRPFAKGLTDMKHNLPPVPGSAVERAGVEAIKERAQAARPVGVESAADRLDSTDALLARTGYKIGHIRDL